jgi:DnaJ-class molecular chaperone
MGSLDKMPTGEKLTTTCPHCKGTRVQNGEPCKPCNGTGRTRQQ